MGNFFKGILWTLFAVALGCIALIFLYWAFMNLMANSIGWAIAQFIITVIFIVGAIQAFKQA